MSFAMYLPRDRASALMHGAPLPERAFGAVVLADISGFTALTDALARELGPHGGAEELTRHLNLVYDTLITIIHRHGGSVVSFSGDAITCWFGSPAEHAQAAIRIGARAAGCGLELQRAMAGISDIMTSAGQRFSLALKVALSVGPVCRFLVGDPGIQRLDVLAGATLVRLAAAEQHTRPGEVVTDGTTAALLAGALELGEWRADAQGAASFVVVDNSIFAYDADAALELAPPVPELMFEPSRSLLLSSIAERLASGYGDAPTELRPAVALFLRFGTLNYDHDPDAGAQLDAYIRWVQGVLARYGGALIDVTIGDKGSYVYATFGAPVAHEKDAERALYAALELCMAPARLAGIGAAQIGMARGTMRTGAYGGGGRLTYGVLGDAANVAARLMQAAAPGQVLVEGALKQACRSLFVWDEQPPLAVKGKPEPLSVWGLLATQRQDIPTFYQGALIGRTAELEHVARAAAPVRSGQFAGVCYVDGDAGIGKSRLVYEACRQLATQIPLTWMYCPSDDVLRGSLRPFATMLQGYFQQSSARDEAENQARFEAILSGLVDTLQVDATLGEQGRALAAELDRTRSFLAALLGLGWSGSLYEQVEPKLRFENTLSGLVTLIKAESLRQPVWLELEDAHWLDPDSRVLVASLCRALTGFPVLIMCAARPDDEGRPTRLAVAESTPICVIDLAALSFESSQAYAEQVLERPLSAQAARFVHERAGGNPFFLEQLLLDLRERRLINADPAIPVDGQATGPAAPPSSLSDVPDTLNSLLVARLDRLDAPVREVVQTAAVLGRAWDMPVLAAMRQGDNGLPAKVRAAENGRIWSPVSEHEYLFRHVLLREAAYGMQLQQQRRDLHRRAVHAIEQEYADSLAPQYAALVYHAREAEDREREQVYARRAGEAAAARYANAEAISFLSRALELSAAQDLEERWAVLLDRERIYDRIGDRSAQAEDIAQLEQLADSLADDEKRAWAQLRLAEHHHDTGNFTQAGMAAQQALARAEAIAAQPLIVRALERLAWALTRQGTYGTARALAQQCLGLAQASSDREYEARALNTLGALAYFEDNLEQASHAYGESLRLFREMGSSRAEATMLYNIGSLRLAMGDIQHAGDMFEQAQSIIRSVGERRIQGILFRNLGIVHTLLGDYAGAETSIRQGIELSRAAGNRWDEALAWSNLSAVFLNRGSFTEAHTYSQQALAMAQPLDDIEAKFAAQIAHGRALLGLARFGLASDVFQAVLASAKPAGQNVAVVNAYEGLARALLALHNLAAALEQVEALCLLTTDRIGHASEPLRVDLTCYQVLHAAGDPRAPAVLDRAYQRLQTYAASLSDEATRRGFLENVPYHRVLLEAWQAAHTAR